MPTLHTYDYAIVRVVPRVERGEFINAGVIVSCKTAGYLQARVEFNAARFAALAPGVDPHDIRAALESIPAICAGGDGAGPLRHLARHHGTSTMSLSGSLCGRAGCGERSGSA